jgi:hypothetical protein
METSSQPGSGAGPTELAAEVETLRRELVEATAELGVLRGQVADFQDQAESQRRRADTLARQLAVVTDTRTYRLGHLMMTPVRVARRALHKVRRRG